MFLLEKCKSLSNFLKIVADWFSSSRLIFSKRRAHNNSCFHPEGKIDRLSRLLYNAAEKKQKEQIFCCVVDVWGRGLHHFLFLCSVNISTRSTRETLCSCSGYLCHTSPYRMRHTHTHTMQSQLPVSSSSPPSSSVSQSVSQWPTCDVSHICLFLLEGFCLSVFSHTLHFVFHFKLLSFTHFMLHRLSVLFFFFNLVFSRPFTRAVYCSLLF